MLQAGPLLINEFMAVNDGTLLDGDGNYSDWIEIHNPTQQTVSLGGWYLTDEQSDLTKWPFPDVSLDPGQYRVVFASGQEVDDHVDAQGYLHTNFRLDGDGEYLALVKDGGTAIAHEFAPEYPQQLEDVSYGISPMETSWETLVAAGATASYHVPGSGDDPLAWTAVGYDDSAWTDTFTVDPAGLLVAEVSTGDTRFVEIQNVSTQPIDATGWSVLVNDASAGNVNDVVGAAWSLSGPIAAGAVLYKTDDVADHYWGSAIPWAAEGPGWVMILDDVGQVMDFVAWGYSQSQLAGLSFDYGGFTNVTLGDQWNGDGAEVGTTDPGGGAGDSSFVAFNDHIRGDGTHVNATDYTPIGTPSGLLKDIDTGLGTTVTLTTSQNGVSWEGTHGNPAPGTDAYEIFNTYVDFSGISGSNASIALSGAAHYTYTFSDLSTEAGTTYSFAGTTVRGRDGYDNRWTLVTLVGADSATAAHSTGDGVVVVSSTEVAILTGENHQADQGFVAAWTQIDPGADGAFAIVSTQYTGEIRPGVVADGSKGYGLAGVRLEEVAPSGPFSWLKRIGDADRGVAGDFVRSSEPSLGAQNADLTVPFGTVLDVTTGLGFSADQPAFETLIQTDVAGSMQDTSASLWTRLEFDVLDTSMFDELTLRMKYDDGFVAYLNGTEIARRNAPDPLAHDSSATVSHPDAQAVVFEEIDATDYLFDLLRTGANVLAIHGLNVDAADGDFLILPELVATSNLDDPQYMTSPTPGAENIAGYLGLVADTRFSHDRGFYSAAIDVEITSDTPGAEIRYTLDGSKPTATTGTVYSGAIHVETTTMLRAAAFRPGYLSTNVDTQTYLFPEAVATQTRPAGYPTSWGAEPSADYDVDQNVSASGQYHDRFLQGLVSIPTVSLVLPMQDFFGPSGLYANTTNSYLEKEASAELIFPDGTQGFQIDAGLKIQGGASREAYKAIKHSMSLRFRALYGAGRLDFPLFDDSPVESFNSIQFRAMYNNSWIHSDSGQRQRAQMIRDQWARDSLLEMGQDDAGRGSYVNLYVNGLFWGVYNLHERPEATHYADYNGGDDERLDALNGGVAIDGSLTAYNEMKATVAGGDWDAIQQVLDVDNYIDWTIIERFGGNQDLKNDGNWRAAGGGPDDAPWHFYSWDTERILEDVNNTSLPVPASDPPALFANLDNLLEFRIRFADRLHMHLFNDGALTPQANIDRWMERADEIDLAIIGESARWGDDRREPPYTRDAEWVTERDRLINSYFPYRTQNIINRYRSDGLYPNTAAPVFYVNGSYRYGGLIASTDQLTMPASGTVYYTIDGSDPRLPGGGVNWAHVQQTTGAPITLSHSAVVRARALSGGEWSALNEAEYFVDTQATAASLVISELNYNPYAPADGDDAYDNDDFEFIELVNTSGQTIDLSGVHFAEGVVFDFFGSAVTALAPQQRAVIARNTAAFQLRYGTGITLAGQYDGQLDNDGDRITLRDWQEAPIVAFRYNDGGNWPGRADGNGASLELIDPAAVPATEPERALFLEDGDQWRSSSEYGGSPGSEGAGPQNDVVINEVLSHTDWPESDTIELHNTTGAAIDIGGWYLSDTNGNYAKFRIPGGTSIPAGGYVVFDEDDFNPTPLTPGPNDFALDGAHGDDVWLLEGDAAGNLVRFVDHLEFGAAVNGESFGRWPNGNGDPYPMTEPTLDPADGQNSGPRVGPVLITEVHYNPGAFDVDADYEFIEICNPTGETVDLTGWRIRKGIDFDFDPGTLLASGETVVVVGFDPGDATRLSAFRDAYGIDASVRILGGYDGRLENVGERVQLQRPDAPPADEPDFIPHLLEDEVRYGNLAPWPVEADGGGQSLNRVASGAWGNDSASWYAAPPTPGTPSIPVSSEVVGRRVFYNASAFDGNSASAGARDDDAIASDKHALLPGETATFANYTSYSRGLNGIMVDIEDLPPAGVLDAGDFQFRVGNSNTPSAWSAGPAPVSITVRPGAGAEGSDRVTIVWEHYAIVKQWLEVTVLATADTGLAEPDVFYFGNAVGEAGNATSDAKVNASDMLLARNNPRNFLNPAPVDFACDFNRDARVNATDMLIARNNQTHFLNALKLITVPAGKAAGSDGALLEKSLLHDTVLAEASSGESVDDRTSTAKPAWMYEFEQLGMRSGQDKKDPPTGDAVDAVFDV
ncbi:MAG: lamin tail domain-containing protein [Pirellulales bacterium]|nr:lamin tail domain-containing protein [Pirellulales bacterium]